MSEELHSGLCEGTLMQACEVVVVTQNAEHLVEVVGVKRCIF